MSKELNDEGPAAQVSDEPGVGAQLAEVLVFLFLIVPSMVIDLFVFKRPGAGFVMVAWATILRDLALVSLIVLFLWHNKEPLSRIGWTSRNAWLDVGLGIVLFVPFFYVFGLLGEAFRQMGLSAPSQETPSFLTPMGIAQVVLAFFMVAVVAISEETIFRGYLLLRLSAVTRSMVLAVILSSGIFSIGHGYEGTAGVAAVGVMGVVFSLIYLWRKSLVAPVVIHFLQDFVGIVLIPLLTLR